MERRQKEAEFLFTSPLPDGHIYGTPFPKSLVERMTLKFPPATIGAPYCGPPPDECCYVFHWTSRGTGSANPDFQLEMIPRCSAAIRAGIQEVAALPTGLILYDMRVFDILPPPWFEYEWGDPPYNSKKATTEDVYQTRNASLLGMPQFVAWDCWAAHVKPKVVGKPFIVTRDRVHSSLREAVLRGVDSDQKLMILRERVEVEEITPTDTPGTEGSVAFTMKGPLEGVKDIFVPSPDAAKPPAFPEWKPEDYWPDPHKEPEAQP